MTDQWLNEEWSNGVLHSVWSHLERQIGAMILGIGQGVLKGLKLPLPLTSLSLEKVEVGSTAPKFVGWKVVRGGALLLIETTIDFEGRIRIVAAANVGPVGIPLQVSVTRILSKARIEMVLGDVFPPAGPVGVGLVGDPELDFEVKPLAREGGVDLMDIGGLNDFVKSTVISVLRGSVTWPNHITILGTEDAKTARAGAFVGIVTVHVVEAKDLQDVEWVGKSDPACELKVANRGHRTRIIEDNLNPKFDETFQFPIGPLDWPTVLDVALNDYDGAEQTESLGYVQIQLAKLPRGAEQDLELKLEGASKGSVHLKITVTEEPKVKVATLLETFGAKYPDWEIPALPVVKEPVVQN